MKYLMLIVISLSSYSHAWTCWHWVNKVAMEPGLAHLLSAETAAAPMSPERLASILTPYDLHDLRSKAFGRANKVIEHQFRSGDIFSLCKAWGFSYEGGDFRPMRTKLLRRIGESELSRMLLEVLFVERG